VDEVLRLRASHGDLQESLHSLQDGVRRSGERLASVEQALADLAAGPRGDCPAEFPFPYRADRGARPSRCCGVASNCDGWPLDADRAGECCGAAHVAMPATYRYDAPRGPVGCEGYAWWALLEEKSTPLWPAMKAVAEKQSREDAEALAAAGYKANKITWAGKDDLDNADVNRARQYVGSAWGKSGARQLATAQKFMGVRPEHDFLEIGCGALNAGQFFIHHLDAGRYVCVDPNEILREKSVRESATLQRNISAKRPRFVGRDDFDPRPAAALGAHGLFDRSWSHSVLSHAADWQLLQYFEVIAATLRPVSGVAMASLRFSDSDGRKMDASHDTSWIYPGVSYFDFAEARCMAQRAGLELSLLPQARLFMTEVVPAEHHDWVVMRRPA